MLQKCSLFHFMCEINSKSLLFALCELAVFIITILLLFFLIKLKSSNKSVCDRLQFALAFVYVCPEYFGQTVVVCGKLSMAGGGRQCRQQRAADGVTRAGNGTQKC